MKIDELQAAEHQLRGFSGELKGDLISLQLSNLIGEYQMLDDNREAVVEQAFKGQFTLTPLGRQTQGVDATIDLKVTADHFELGVKGKANLNGADGNEMLLNLDVSDFQIAGDLLNKDFGPLTPFGLAANVAVADNRISVDSLQLGAGENDLQGMLRLKLAEGEKSGLAGLSEVVAKLTATQLVLQPLADLNEVAEEVPVETVAPASEASSEGPAKLFSAEPLPLEQLNAFVVDVSITAQRLNVLEAEFTEFKLSATSEDSVLRIEPVAKFGGGGFAGHFNLAPNSESADLDIDFNLVDINLEAFGLVSKEELTGGKTDLDFTIKSTGASTAALAANSTGLILLTVVDAVVQNDTFELAGSDLIMEALSKLNPFGKTDPTTELSCALVKFEGEDGVWNTKNQIVVETEKMEIVGTGKIDLNDETLDIGITPSAKGGVGVNVGSLVKFLKMGGPLTDPRPQASAAGLLKSGVAIGAAASTGGLSILADGLAKRVLNAGDACAKAREQVVEGEGGPKV